MTLKQLNLVRKIADPEFVNSIGWRDSIVTFVRTHSKVTITMLTRIGAHPTYNQIKWFLNKLKPQFNLAHSPIMFSLQSFTDY